MTAPARIRKAWRVSVKGHADPMIHFAATRSRARAEAIAAMRNVWDVTWKQAIAHIKSVCRAPERDVSLPERHPLASQLHPDILHCVVHAYGGTGLKAGYRDHFYTSASDWRLKAAVYHGLFDIYRRDRGRDGRPDQIMYELTAMGRNVARGEAETYPSF